MQNQIIKILVADDHTLFRQGIIKLIESKQNYVVVAEAENGNELIKKYFSIRPDVMLVDISMPEMSGIQAVEKILSRDREAKALFLSMYDNSEYVYKILKLGGKGLINKNILEGELFFAIDEVYNGEKYFGTKWNEKNLTQLVSDFEKDLALGSGVELHFREIQVLKMIVEGTTSQKMADQMKLSKKTIDFYRSSLLKKLKLKTQADLVKFGVTYFKINN